jgi:hypothetical protein
MSVRSQSKVFCRPKLEPLTTPALRFGVLYELTTLNPPFTAKDMQGLYTRVLKGVYPKIPSHYSSDLSAMIKALL